MTKRDMLVMLMLEGKTVFTADPRGSGGGVILSAVAGAEEIVIRNDKFRFKVKPDDAWFHQSNRFSTVTIALETIDKLAALLGE